MVNYAVPEFVFVMFKQKTVSKRLGILLDRVNALETNRIPVALVFFLHHPFQKEGTRNLLGQIMLLLLLLSQSLLLVHMLH